MKSQIVSFLFALAVITDVVEPLPLWSSFGAMTVCVVLIGTVLCIREFWGTSFCLLHRKFSHPLQLARCSTMLYISVLIFCSFIENSTNLEIFDDHDRPDVS